MKNIRKLGDAAPDKLRIIGGKIVMDHGGMPDKYLSEWQEAAEIENGTPVCVVPREHLEKLENRLQFLLGMTFC